MDALPWILLVAFPIWLGLITVITILAERKNLLHREWMFVGALFIPHILVLYAIGAPPRPPKLPLAGKGGTS